MCWNKEVSLTTFILAVLGVIYLFKRNGPNDRWIAVFAGTVAMIQLAEYFMWSDLDCGTMNRYASIFALVVLALEPLMNMAGGIYFSDTKYKDVLKYMAIAYLIYIIFYYYTKFHNKEVELCGTTPCEPNNNPLSGFFQDKVCNLQWHFLDLKGNKLILIWVLFLILPFFFMDPPTHSIVFSVLSFLSLFMGAKTNISAIGSVWCWLAAILLFVKILI
ncbi:hypothetical protein QKU48_gp1244 [Fadolivirus algeromassiliense]|jgi:hypothetical protein|uniref:Uncharacterized protein n=1 Tax=Fadolivirus FV1/VV64 TaxID=3070911 RepID=A0A7D3R1R0_9VIRU|nr:hypothetical protein QKU48_gp1244 [Fadolivirus algeromassiliense]QKF94702.1 hypothetical protein Fadolivirus_1_1244 [Fadolivirus FV1/VV64]